MNVRLAVAVTLAASSVACSRSDVATTADSPSHRAFPASPPREAEQPLAPAGPPPVATAAPAPAHEAKSAGAARGDSADEARRENRPGLGTEWGEWRDSRVNWVGFERETPDSPLSVNAFYYNDEAGVRSQLGSERAYWDDRRDGVSAAGGAITIRIVDDRGSTLPTIDAGDRAFVVGHGGDRYSIRIQNHSSERFEAVATVDGLDVIDGQPGSFEKRGYLVGPWATVDIDGFRQSGNGVAAFRFGAVRDSYAAKRGRARDVGVIGVAVFQERGSTWRWRDRDVERRNGADPFPGRYAPPPSY